MSYDSSKYYDLAKGLKTGIFSGGFVDNVAEIDMAWCYSPYLRNCRLDGQSIVSRPWHQLFSTLASGDYPRGIGAYLRTVASSTRLVVRHNKDADEKLYTIDSDGVATSINTGSDIASDARMRFFNVADVVYCMNGVDKFGKLSGTTYTIPSAVPSNFAPAFAVPFDWKMVASGRPANPNKIYYSVADNYEDFTSAGTDTGTTIETVTGLASTNQALFYFTKNTIAVTDKGDIVNTDWVISYNSTYLQTQEGAVNHDSIVVVGTEVFYVTPSNSISQITRWANVNWYDNINLSDREWEGITEYMKQIPKWQTDSRWYYQEDTNLIHWFFKGQDSSIYNKTVVYDVINKKFLIDTNRYFYGGLFFEGKNFTISNLEPKVFRDEYSYDDQGTPIPFEYRSKYFYVSGATFKNILRESRTLLDMNILAVVIQEIWMDWKMIDTKTIDMDNLPEQLLTGIGIQEIGTYAIGTEGLSITPNSDMYETYILRTKGNVSSKRWVKYQRRWRMWVVWGRVRLKNFLPRLESAPPQATNLTE